jgi:hypothetical protein
MRSGDIAPELKPDKKLREHLKERDARVSDGVIRKSPSELKSKAMKRKFAARGKGK